MTLYEIHEQLSSGKNIFQIPLKATFYARVSTEKDEQVHSLQNQKEYYQKFILSNPYWEYVNGYIDEGISGTSVKGRKNFISMIEDARNQKFNLILTKEISRFSRNTFDSIKYTQMLLSYGIGVYFQSDNINTFLPDSELRLTIMSSIAQEEVRKISERIRFGLKESVSQGKVLGNDNIWGYTKINGRLSVDENEAEIIKKIYHLYVNEKMGIRTIANILTNQGITGRGGLPFSFSTVRGILLNPKYKGTYCGSKSKTIDYRSKKRIILPKEDWKVLQRHENVPAIIDDDLWEQANTILNSRNQKGKETNYHNRYGYSGKIICNQHQTPFYRTVYKAKGQTKEVWQCKRYKENGIKGCDLPVLYTKEMNDLLLDDFYEKINLKKVIDYILFALKCYEERFYTYDHIEKIIKKKKKSAEKKNKLLDMLLEGMIDDQQYKEKTEEINQKIQKLEELISKAEDQPVNHPMVASEIENISNQNIDELICEIVKKIFVSKKTGNTICLNIDFYDGSRKTYELVK